MADDLTDLQARFVEEYLVDLNATAAAIRAGYSPDSARTLGSRTRAMPAVDAAIRARQAELAASLGITQEHVLRERARLAFGDIRRVMDWGPAVPVYDEDTGEARPVQGIVLKPADDLDDDAAAAIAEIRQTKEGLAIKLHDKPAALNALAKQLGFDAPTKVEHSGTVDHRVSMSKLDMARRIARLLRKGAEEAKG